MSSHGYLEQHGMYGLMAEFKHPHELLKAAHVAFSAGYRKMEGYSPMPVEGLNEALGFKRHFVSLVVLTGGLCGMLGGFFLMFWITTVAYAHNVAGHPMNSWVSYIPPTFEMTVLFAALSAVVGMFAMNGLPEPYHPVFNVPEFAARGARDRFFLVIETADPLFDLEKTRLFMDELHPMGVFDVEK
ncbi:MAG: DUF3341 domain-containing protein [Bryobacteraceae bacterium]|jgi:hypothetical protein